MSEYRLSIITPSGKAFDDTVISLTAQGSEGSFGILQHHTPFVTLLKEGHLSLKQAGGETHYQTGSGILEVNNNHDVLILADYIKIANKT